MRWTERQTAPAPPMEWRLVLALLAVLALLPSALLPHPLALAGSAAALGLAAFALSPVRVALGAVLLGFVGLSLLLGLLLAPPLLWLLRSAELPAVLAASAATALAVTLAWRAVLPLGLLQQAGVESGGAFATLRRAWRLAAALRQTQPPAQEGFLPGLALSLFVLLGLAPLAPQLGEGLRWSALLLQIPCLFLATVGPRRLARLLLIAEPMPAAHAASTPQPAALREAPPSETPPDPAEALYEAVRAGQVESALHLIAAGADLHRLPGPDQRDQRSLAMLAALLPDLRLLRELIARGVDPNRRHGGLTPLLAATRDSYQGRPDAVMMLLANGADAAAADGEGRTPLHFAALAGEPEVAALLLDAGAPLEALDREGLSPLGRACASGNWRLAKFLLDRGAKPAPEGGQPCLIAASGGEDDAAGVQLLLKHRARVDARGPLQRTALHAAALAGNAGIVRCLLQAGAEIDARDSHGVTPLMEAVRSGAEAVVEALAARQPDANAVDASGRCVLTIACRSRQATPSMLRRLLALGADPQRRDEAGHRPLDDAVAQGRWPLVALLDPDYPLPASLQGELDEIVAQPAEAGAEPADPLDPVLRASHNGDRRALRALLGPVSGLESLAPDGSPLLHALLDRGGAAVVAIEVLLERGAPCGGGAGLARYLAACAEALDTSRGHENLALALLQRGADAFAPAPTGEPTLHLALRLGWLRLAEALLAMGSDTEQRDAHGWTALYLATNLGLESAVKLLARFGARPRARAADGQTAIGLALAGGRNDLARWLDWPGWSPPRRPLQPLDLVQAAMAGDAVAVERLLDLGLPIDAVDAQGCTALLRAAGSGALPIVRLLLASGARSDIPARTGATALSAAISTRQTAVVQALLDAGVAVDSSLPGGATCLMVACALGQDEIAALLLARGARVDLADEQGNTALLAAAGFAVLARSAEPANGLLRRLIAAGADIEARNRRGESALLLLLGAHQDAGVTLPDEALVERVGLLLGAGARLDAQDRRGLGPLHLAALHGLNRCVSGLLAAGADRQQHDALGRSPRDLALQRGFVDIAAELAGGGQPTAPSLARFLRPRT
jgi:uncharacterized protein